MRAYESPDGGYSSYDDLDAKIALAEQNRLAGIGGAVNLPGQIVYGLASFQEQQARNALYLSGISPTVMPYEGGINPGFAVPDDLSTAVAATPPGAVTVFGPNLGAATSLPAVAVAATPKPNFVEWPDTIGATVAPTYSGGVVDFGEQGTVSVKVPPAVTVFVPVATTSAPSGGTASFVSEPVTGGTGGGGVSGDSGKTNNGVPFVHPVSGASGVIPVDWNRTGTAANGDPVFTVVDNGGVIQTFALDSQFQAYFNPVMGGASAPTTTTTTTKTEKETSTAAIVLGGIAFAAKAFLFS